MTDELREFIVACVGEAASINPQQLQYSVAGESFDFVQQEAVRIADKLVERVNAEIESQNRMII